MAHLLKGSPKDYRIDLPSWRDGQLKAIRWIQKQDKKYLATIAPTGSGKSAIGAAQGAFGNSVQILTRTKALQQQYDDTRLDGDVLFGMNNYACQLNMGQLTADHCLHMKAPHKCEFYDTCGYFQQRNKTRTSVRAVLNYSYYFNIYNNEGWPSPDVLFCDEAHDLPNLLMDRLTFTANFSWLDKIRCKIPAKRVKSVKIQIEWAFKHLMPAMHDALREFESEDNQRKIKNMEARITTLKHVIDLYTEDPDAIICDVDEAGIGFYPLSPRFGAYKFFSNQRKVVFASATIGRPDKFRKVLGFSKMDWASYEVAPRFPAESRPVYFYTNSPRMNYKSSESDKNKQAKMIASAIDEHDPTWSGLIHVNSKYQAKDLAYRLRKVLKDPSRVWIPDDEGSTLDKIESLNYQLELKSNTICISWCFWEGIDAGDMQFSIVAKAPYASLDRVGSARKDYDIGMYFHQAASKMQQALGRTRRGDQKDYEVEGQPRRKFVAIFDQSAKSLLGHMDNYVKESVVHV